MSSVTLGQDKQGKDVTMSYGALYKGDPELQAKFYRFIDWYSSYDETSSPRHGLYSIVSRRTNSYIYDHPALQNLCKTAFTTGDAIFFNKEFFAELLDHRKLRTPSGKPFNTLEFVHTHELSHIMKMHFSRLKQFTPEESNIIGDMNINLEILRTFDWHYPPGWGDNAIGFRDVDYRDYSHLSEESIARKMMERRNAILQRKNIDPVDATKQQKMNALYEVIGWDTQEPENGNDSSNDNTSGDPSQSQPDGGDGGGSAPPQPDEDTSPSEEKDPHDEHMITNEELADALEKAGDKEVADQLGISSDMTEEEKEQAVKDAKERLTNDLAEAQKERRRAQSRQRSVPGEHVEDQLEDSLKVDRQPKIKWTLATNGMINGSGFETIENDGVQNDFSFIDPTMMGLTDHVYLPGQMVYEDKKACYLFIIDTSASMTMDMIEESVAEIKGMLEDIESDETKVFLVSADTVSRGVALDVNPSNIEQCFEELKLYGRGGTDLTAGIVNAMNLVEEQFPDYPIGGIIYGTDLGDLAPKRENLPDNLPELIFITAPEMYNTHFDAAVSDFAKVVQIDDGEEAEFENEFEMTM